MPSIKVSPPPTEGDTTCGLGDRLDVEKKRDFLSFATRTNEGRGSDFGAILPLPLSLPLAPFVVCCPYSSPATGGEDPNFDTCAIISHNVSSQLAGKTTCFICQSGCLIYETAPPLVIYAYRFPPWLSGTLPACKCSPFPCIPLLSNMSGVPTRGRRPCSCPVSQSGMEKRTARVCNSPTSLATGKSLRIPIKL